MDEVFASFEQIVYNHGYTVQTHTVVTEDGYVLTIHRIPSKLGDPTKKPGPPVLL